ncbi:MAG: fatty acid desaturase [Myxococcota bacterium]
MSLSPALLASRERQASRRKGLLRYNIDVIPLLWVQATLLLSLVPFLVELPLWGQVLLAIPVFFLRSSCPYLQHNQGHLPAFWRRWPNHVYDLQLALMTGYVTSLWELQHARGHHRHYLTPALDPASIIDPRTGKPMPRWRYCVVGNLTIIRDAIRIARQERALGRGNHLPKLVTHLVVATVLCGALAMVNPWAFFWFILVPDVIAGYTVWMVSYDHHLDVKSTSHYDGSHTILGRAFNRFTFNIGHHAAHHEKPTLHWSLLPRRTAHILHLLDPASVKGTLEPEVAHLVTSEKVASGGAPSALSGDAEPLAA